MSPLQEGSTVYKSIDWSVQQMKKLKKVLMGSEFQYGSDGKETTLRKLLNFTHFFGKSQEEEEDEALIK